MTKTNKIQKTEIAIETKVSKNFQTYVPKKVRDVMKISDANDLVWEIKDEGTVEIKKKKSFQEILNETSSIAKDFYKKHGDGAAYVRKLRDEWDD